MPDEASGCVSPRLQVGLARFEASVNDAHAEQRKAEVELSAAKHAATAAAMALEAANEAVDRCKDKTAKGELIEAAAAAMEEAGRRDSELAAAEAANDAVRERLHLATMLLQRSHAALVSEALTEEGREMRPTYRQAAAETHAWMHSAHGRGRQLNTGAVVEQPSVARAEEEVYELALRRKVDPFFARDSKTAAERFQVPAFVQERAMVAGSINSTLGVSPRGPLPPHAPRPIAPLPRNTQLCDLARFRERAKMVLHEGGHGGRTRKQTSVCVLLVGPGELPPAEVQPEPWIQHGMGTIVGAQHGAQPPPKYLVRTDSSTTTWERGRVVWVDQDQLTPRPVQRLRTKAAVEASEPTHGPLHSHPAQSHRPVHGSQTRPWVKSMPSGRSFAECAAGHEREVQRRARAEREAVAKAAMANSGAMPRRSPIGATIITGMDARPTRHPPASPRNKSPQPPPSPRAPHWPHRSVNRPSQRPSSATDRRHLGTAAQMPSPRAPAHRIAPGSSAFTAGLHTAGGRPPRPGSAPTHSKPAVSGSIAPAPAPAVPVPAKHAPGDPNLQTLVRPGLALS